MLSSKPQEDSECFRGRSSDGGLGWWSLADISDPGTKPLPVASSFCPSHLAVILMFRVRVRAKVSVEVRDMVSNRV